jgi:hypothetical protein
MAAGPRYDLATMDTADAHPERQEAAIIPPGQVTIGIELWNAAQANAFGLFQSTVRTLWAQHYAFGACEHLVAVSDDGWDDARIRAVLPRARILRLRGLTYYSGKNALLREAGGEYVVLTDSDMRYAPGWLGAMLAAFTDRVRLVVGNTRYQPRFLSRPLDFCDWAALAPQSGPTDFLYANNFAVRRSHLPGLVFPEGVGPTNGGAEKYWQPWLREVGAWFCKEALAYHPRQPLLVDRLRAGAYHINVRRVDPGVPFARMASIPVLGPLAVAGGTAVKAGRRAWRARAELPGGPAGLALCWTGIGLAKTLELAGALAYSLAPARFEQRTRWFHPTRSP